LYSPGLGWRDGGCWRAAAVDGVVEVEVERRRRMVVSTGRA
jgi:hypothetical protein